jgi:hypothetical protein
MRFASAGHVVHCPEKMHTRHAAASKSGAVSVAQIDSGGKLKPLVMRGKNVVPIVADDLVERVHVVLLW